VVVVEAGRGWNGWVSGGHTTYHIHHAYYTSSTLAAEEEREGMDKIGVRVSSGGFLYD